MEKLIITGGKPLLGKVELCGAKNSGFKLMIASIFCEGFCTLHNFSKIGDVYSTAEIIKDLGGEVNFGDNHVVQISGKGLKKQVFSEITGKLSRASTYFIGPLIHCFGQAILPVPGGCKIGRRPLDRHLEGIKALGAEVKVLEGRYEINAKRLIGATYRFPKNTHGGTDTMIIAGVTAKGKTILENAALEPEVDDLINFLNKMGAKIKRMENRTIVIEGVDELKPADFFVMYDRNEAVTFACAALATKGEIVVSHAEEKNLSAFLAKVSEIGGGYETVKDGIKFFYNGPLKPTNVTTMPHPGFMTDWMSLWSLLMTQTEGMSIIHETIFENRFAFVSELQKMNAKIELFNPQVEDPQQIYNFNTEDDKPEYFHAARIYGPAKLVGTSQVISDVRAGACLILASLIAHGKSELIGVEHVDRGYENLENRLRGLGAEIQRITI